MFDSLLFSVLLSPFALGVYRLSYHAVVKYRLERYVIFAPWIVLRDDRGVLVLDAEKDNLDLRIDELKDSVIHGDCVEAMKKMPEDSIHAVVTDPPYGLNFMGASWDDFEPGEYQKFCQEWGKQALRVLKPGGFLLSFSGTRTFHRAMVGLEDAGFNIKDTVMWLHLQGYPKYRDIGKLVDNHLGKKDEQEEVREHLAPVTDSGTGRYGWNVKGEGKTEAKITEPATSEAERWDGWATPALKPAYEPIVLCQKPREGSYAQNVLKHGVGGINIDRCKIPADEKIEKGRGGRNTQPMYSPSPTEEKEYQTEGRFPANVILDPRSAEMLKEQKEKIPRCFYCPKPGPKGQRNAGLDDVESVEFGVGGGARAALERGEDEYDAGQEGDWNKIGESKNEIEALKPVNLMRYLVRLVTPPDGVVVDPFAGSGTTGCACVVEGFDYILIEKRERFARVIAPRRVEYWSNPRHWNDLKDHYALPEKTKHDAEKIPKEEKEPKEEEQTQLLDYSSRVKNSKEPPKSPAVEGGDR